MSTRALPRRVMAVLTGACALGQFVAAAGHIRWLKLLTRPPLMMLLAGYATAGTTRATRRAVRPLAAGLVLAALGDTVLMVDSQRAFLAGIALFLGTHLCYLTGYLRAGAVEGIRHRPGMAIGCAVAYATLAVTLWRRLGPLRWPVICYGMALFGMAAAACSIGHGPSVGALLFAVSDVLIALGVARIRFRGQDAAIAATYFTGQVLIARNWLRTTGLAGAGQAG